MNHSSENAIPAATDLPSVMKPLPSLPAIGWIAWYSLREMSRRRRLISLGAINLLPVVVVLVVRLWFADQGITPHLLLMPLTHQVFIPFLIPIVALAVGASAIGEQVEEGTIVYYWTRPVRRRAIFLGRLAAAQSVSILLLSASLVLCFLVMVSQGPGVITWDFLKLYLDTFLVIFLGAFSYAALFAAMGTLLRKPVVPAILFAFVWEGLVSEIPARIQETTLRFHLQNLVPKPVVETNDLPGILRDLLQEALKRDPVPAWRSVVILLLVAVVTTAAGIWLLRQKEIQK